MNSSWKPSEWWFDSGVTRHVCPNKETFAIYDTAGSKNMIFMGNTASTKAEGSGKIFL